MLQRAASNAYSWWWASHIRTKQSKWMEQNLQDMEEKVQNVLKLIEEDGDSFAKRAEMYYKKRPELIHFVEESYRAYRALAERYDHISTELQNANNTIATVFPEKVQFAMEEDEDEASTPKFPKKPLEASKANVPNVPNIPKDLKGVFASATKKLQPNKSMKVTSTPTVPKSGLSKPEGLQEIDRLQKDILTLQTEKEFVKSSYEGGLAKYWEIEEKIMKMQEKVCSLQDEFGSGIVIEDDEARTLMASAALKSCQESLAQLQVKQERSAHDAAVESMRIVNAREKLKSLKDEFLQSYANELPQTKDESPKAEDLKGLDQEELIKPQERQDLKLLREKIKEHFEVESNSSLTVTELAENIDELVNKVISLEASVSSQTSLIIRLRKETDELQAQIQTLEDDKASLISGKNDLNEKLTEMEAKLCALHDLERSVEDQNSNLQTHFTEARFNLDHLSEKLHCMMQDDESQVELQVPEQTVVEPESQEEGKGHEGPSTFNDNLEDLLNVKGNDELKVSNESQEEFKLSKQSALNHDGLQESLYEKPDEGLKISNESQEEFKVSKQEGALNHDDRQESQFEKPDEELKVSDSSQREEECSTKVCLLSESSDKQEQQNHSDASKEATGNISVGERDYPLEKSHDRKIEERVGKQASPKMVDEQATIDMQVSPKTVDEEATKQDDEPDWKQLFTNGMENREKILLSEYTSVLRSFKEIKKQLAEAESLHEKKNGDSLFDTTVQLRELKSANAKKDEQIRILRQKLSLLQVGLGEENESEKPTVTESMIKEKEVTEEFRVIFIDHQETISEIEEKFRSSIDEVLEENLDFWLRFSTTFHEIQKFETQVKDLQSELLKLKEKKKTQEGSSTVIYSLKSDAKPLYNHLTEIDAELSVWLEKSVSLKDELKSRFSSLCDIQEEITASLKESAEDDDFKFTSYQAAKFQGEILNMKQENNKVADELQAGLDHVTTLQLDVEKTLAKLNEEFELSGSKNRQSIELEHSGSRSRVPLRSFIFGMKPKRQRQSIFARVYPALQLHRKYNASRSGPSV